MQVHHLLFGGMLPIYSQQGSNFRSKYTYGLLITQGVSEKYKIADLQEKKFFEKKYWVSKPLFVRTSVCPNLCLSELLFVRTSVCPNFDASKEMILLIWTLMHSGKENIDSKAIRGTKINIFPWAWRASKEPPLFVRSPNLYLSEPMFVGISVCPDLCLPEPLFVRTFMYPRRETGSKVYISNRTQRRSLKGLSGWFHWFRRKFFLLHVLYEVQRWISPGKSYV